MEKEITLSNGKLVKVREMKYLEASEIDTTQDKKQSVLKLFKLSTNDLTDEEIINLSLRDGQLIERTISELNGFKSTISDFTNPIVNEKQSAN
jgi:hypothetical protein